MEFKSVFRWWESDPNGYGRHVAAGLLIALLIFWYRRKWSAAFWVVLAVAVAKELYDHQTKQFMESLDILFTMFGVLLAYTVMQARRVRLTALLTAVTLLCSVSLPSSAAGQESGSKPLYVGISANTIFLDAREGPFRNGAGAGVNLVLSHQADRFFAHGEVGWLNMIGDPDNFQIANANAALGIMRGRMSLAAEGGYLHYFAGRDSGDMTLGLQGRFFMPISNRVQINAGARGGLLPLADKTTLYGGVFINALWNLD